MMSVAESYEDRDWWPCKADMQDKIKIADAAIASLKQFPLNFIDPDFQF